jgi:hypothetical protein
MPRSPVARPATRMTQSGLRPQARWLNVWDERDSLATDNMEMDHSSILPGRVECQPDSHVEILGSSQALPH